MKSTESYGWCSDPALFQALTPQLKWLNYPTRSGLLEILRLELEAPQTSLALVPLLYGDLERLARKGLLLPLTRQLEAVRQALPDERFLALCTVDDELYGVPDDAAPYVLARRNAPGHAAVWPMAWPAFDLALNRVQNPLRLIISKGGFNTRMGFILSVLAAHGVRLDRSLDGMLKSEQPLADAYVWVLRATADGGWLDPNRLIRSFEGLRKDPALKAFAEDKCDLWTGWANELRNLPVATVGTLQLARLPHQPGVGAKQPATQPVRGRAWCIPGNVAAPALALEALRALLAPAVAKELELAGDTNFNSRRWLWNDPDLLARRPLYRYAETLLDGTLCAFDNLDEKWRMVEWAFRTTLAERAPAERFLARLGGKERAAVGKGSKHPLVRKALAHIEKTLGKVQSRNEIARQLGLTSDHLNRVFTKEMGESVGAYLMRCRLEQAKVLLQDGGTSVKAVALRLGFKTSSYFSRAYKKHWGVSPLNAQRALGEY